MTSFHAEKCCNLVREHEASACMHLCSSICQFLIHSTVVLVAYLCRYLPDADDGHDVTVNRADGVRPAAASRVTKATPGTGLASLPDDSLCGAGTVHGNSRDRLLRMRTAEHLQCCRRAQSTVV